MDLAQLDINRVADAGLECQVRHPITDAPLDIWITLMGADSQAYRTAMLERVRDLQRARPVDGDVPERSAAQIEEDAVVVCARCTRGWRGVQIDGVDFPHSPENAEALYRRFAWLRYQVNEFIEERDRFLPGSATPS